MGAAQSQATTTATVRQKILNETEINMIRDTTNKKITESLSSESSSCSSASTASQTIDSTRDINLSGSTGAKIGGINQYSKMKMNFSCMNESKMATQIATDIANEFGAKLDTMYDSDALAQLDAAANGAATQGIAGVGYSSANANTNTNLDIDIKNKIGTNMKNIITNEIKNTIKTENIKSCFASSLSTQQIKDKLKLDASNSTNATVGGIDQKSDMEIVMSCINKTENGVDVFDKIAGKINETSIQGVKTKSEAASTSNSSGSAETKGLDTLISSITGPVKYIMIAVVVIIIIGLIVGLIWWMNGGKDTVDKVATKKQKGGDILYSFLMKRKHEIEQE